MAEWSDAMIAHVRQRREEGLTPIKIAAELGVSPNTVAGKIWRMGLSDPRKGQIISDAECAAIVAALPSRLPAPVVPRTRATHCLTCDKLLTGRRQIFYCSGDCQRRGQRADTHRERPTDPVLRALWAAHATYSQIRAFTGMSNAGIDRRARRLGLPKKTGVPKPLAARAPKQKRPPAACRHAAPKRQPDARQATARLIPLREVYRFGAELELPSAKRGDLAAVNAAMKARDPAHVPFVLDTSRSIS